MPRLVRAAAPPRAVSEFLAEITPLSCRRLRASIVLGSSCDINPDVGSMASTAISKDVNRASVTGALGSADPNSCPACRRMHNYGRCDHLWRCLCVQDGLTRK